MAYAIGANETRSDNYSTSYDEIDGDLDDIELGDMTPEYGRRIFPSRLLSYGRRINRHNLPTIVGIKNGNAPITEVGSVRGACQFVSQIFVEIAEEFEPGLHQLFPMQVVRKRLQVVRKDETNLVDRFWLNVCTRLATVHPTESNPPLMGTVWSPGGGSVPDVRLVLTKMRLAVTTCGSIKTFRARLSSPTHWGNGCSMQIYLAFRSLGGTKPDFDRRTPF